MITIIDYGMGNVGSIRNMFRRIGVTTQVTADPDVIGRAQRLILPGVGAFDTAMERIHELGILETLNKKALQEKIPVLGICLGMQLLTDGSEEGRMPGLGWIPGGAFRFSQDELLSLKVPHMGWNTVTLSSPSRLTMGFEEGYRFYFVHSYYVRVLRSEYSILRTEYGVRFDSGIQRDNIYGTQFHPEKSHRFGMKLLSNFAQL